MEPTRVPLAGDGWLTCTVELDLAAVTDADWEFIDSIRRTILRRRLLHEAGDVVSDAHLIAITYDNGETCLRCGAAVDMELEPRSKCPGWRSDQPIPPGSEVRS